MFVSFIDFKKAYQRVDQGKLWGCLKGMEGSIIRCEL